MGIFAKLVMGTPVELTIPRDRPLESRNDHVAKSLSLIHLIHLIRHKREKHGFSQGRRMPSQKIYSKRHL